MTKKKAKSKKAKPGPKTLPNPQPCVVPDTPGDDTEEAPFPEDLLLIGTVTRVKVPQRITGYPAHHEISGGRFLALPGDFVVIVRKKNRSLQEFIAKRQKGHPRD